MKRYISCLLTLALLVPAFVSCTREFQDDHSQNNTHLVYFYTSNPETRTGLTIDEGWVYPDWRETKEANLHFFEIPENGGDPTYGDALDIVESVDNTTARFVASFTEEMTIIADPSTRAGGSDMFYYGAVVAQMPDEDDFTFVIPAKQKPDAGTLKDPDADFLIGYSRKACDAYVDNSEVVDLYFDRVAALGRLSLSNFKGANEKVKSVTINSTAGLVGSAAYANIHFGDKNTVDFTRTEGPLTLTYDTGEDLTEGAFEAYFVVIPGEATITSIEVLTDQYKYTKTLEGGKPITFSNEKFKNINVDLENAVAEKVSSVWYKASVLDAGYDYMLVSANNAMLVSGTSFSAVPVTAKEDGTIEIEASKVTLWTVAEKIEYYDDDKTKPAGHYTLKNGDNYLQRNSDGQGTNTVAVGGVPSNGKYYVWEYDGEHLYHLTSGNNTVYNYFLHYSSGWIFSNSSSISSDSPTTYFYSERLPIVVSFASAEAKYDWDEKVWTVEAPALTAPEGATVTYSSSNEDVATIAEDGTVTPKAVGSTRITATVAGNDEHQGGFASYNLAVTTNKITTWYKAEEMVDGEDYLIISHEIALQNNNGSAGAISLSDYFSGDEILYNAPADVLWKAKATSTSGIFTLENNGQYLTRTSSSSGYSTSYAPGASSSASSYYQWSYNSETERISTKGNSTYYVYYSTGNTKWSMSTTEADHPAALYTSVAPRAPRNLSFGDDPVTVTHDLATQGTDVAEPTLTGASDAALVGVTYAVTEGTDVASVDATTGEITLKNVTGSAVITASATRSDDFKAESVSYTLIVKDSSIPTKRYVLASEIVAGKEYLIISNGYALKNSGSNGSTQDMAPVGGVIEFESDYDFTGLLWTATRETSLPDNGDYTLQNGGKYIRRPNQGGTTLSIESKPDSFTKYFVWLYDGTHLYHHNMGGSNGSTAYVYWLHYDGGWKFAYQATTDPNHENAKVTQLYVEDDGGVTPPTPEEQEQNLSFPEASYTAQMGTAFTAPVLSGAKTTVTYSSSAEGVATVDASTGAVTLVGPGETTITASAPAGTVDGISYKAGSAQYTLTVSPASASSTYVLISSVSELVSGASYLLVSADANNYNGADHKKVFTGETSGAAEDVTPDGNTITGNYSDYEFTISVKSASNNTYVLNGKNGYMTRGTTDPYISFSSSEATLTLNPDKTTAANQAFFFYVMNNSNQDTFYYNKNGNFKIGNTGGTYGCHLYMRYNGEELAQNLSFSKDAASYNMASSASFTAPTLSGAMTTVTYSSSKPGVATVDASTGAVSFVGVGETTITATAVADTYNGINYGTASASYTLTVKNSAQTAVYYTKVNSRDDLPGSSQTSATGNYIFVYESGNKAYVFKAICDGTPTGAGNAQNANGHVELTKSGSAIEVALSDDGIEATDDVIACQLQLAHHSTASRNDWNIKPVSLGTYWIRVYNDGSSVRILAMTSAGYSGTFTFEGSGNNLEVKRSDSSRDAYWSYNATNNCFEATSTASKISIYKLEDSSNP